jgi:UDP-N-acetylmuramate dehydrogenase
MELSRLTTMRVGGPASHYVAATTRAELVDAALHAWRVGDEWLALGGGSNVIIADAGFDGTVIHVQTKGIRRLEDGGGRVRLSVEAGESWDGLVAHAVAHGWAGIEALSGIPGTVGAAPLQNIGAYGQDLAGSLVSVDFLDYLSGSLERLSADDLELGYRTSALKRGRQGIVLAVALELAASAEGLVEFPQLATALGVGVGERVAISAVRSSVLALRAAKGMLLNDADPDSVSCGSFFTNPIVSENFARRLPTDAPRWPIEPEPEAVAVPLGSMPQQPVPASDLVKLSAAWLIEQAGITKGFALPGSPAAISSKHTLAITNRGGATAEQVAELARYIRARVSAAFGVELQPEPVAIGVEL